MAKGFDVSAGFNSNYGSGGSSGYSGYSPQIQSFLGSWQPVGHNFSIAGDAVANRNNANLNYAQNRNNQRAELEWANKQRMYDPSFWQQAFSGGGGGGSGTLSNLANIEQSPAYKWRYDQGLEAVNRTAAAKGMLGSGNRLAELTKYGQGMASQEYDNEFDRQYRLKALEQQRQLAQQQNAMQGMSSMFKMMR